MEADPWETNNTNADAVVWRERERRQRSLKSFMTILFMLILLNDEAPERTRRRKKKTAEVVKMDPIVFQNRQYQDQALQYHAKQHPRYAELLAKNDQQDFQTQVTQWAELNLEQTQDEFAQDAPKELIQTQEKRDAERTVQHFAWNTTGFYRGEWQRSKPRSKLQPTTNSTTYVDAIHLQDYIRALQKEEGEEAATAQSPRHYAGVRFLPPGFHVVTRDDHNYTSMRYDEMTILLGDFYDPEPRDPIDKIPLTQTSGKVAFQFYSRKIPSMTEMSIVDGLIKLYDSDTPGISTRKDVLLRVRGVYLHSIGQLSLVSAGRVGRSVFTVDEIKSKTRKLKEEISKVSPVSNLTKIRDDAIALFGLRENETDLITFEDIEGLGHVPNFIRAIPYPYVMDDANETLRKEKTKGARKMPQREQHLETNAGDCEFEITFNAAPVEWTIGAWRNLMIRRLRERNKLDPSYTASVDEPEPKIRGLRGNKKKRAKLAQDEALVINLIGSLQSPNCAFAATLNATALRTDWDVTTSKAVTYSFYMMLVCLTQIVLLLRQLLHSQGTSAAIRVSLLGIGWQTVIDALLCLGHVYLSLAMQVVFTAFASVAFFKLLVFCVIEMKYMGIIVQARNTNNGGEGGDTLRRQVAIVHLRFYSAAVAVFILLFYITDQYTIPFYLLLYSFWVPQIALNVVTEAKQPLHKYFIYGMSITRLIPPIYFFGYSRNFLHEVYVELHPNPLLCQCLVLWVGIQAAVLIAQSKYGARFMIPARFLPPKFDYHRAIPANMLPSGVPALLLSDSDSESPKEDSTKKESRALHTTSNTTRSRKVKRKSTGEAAPCPTLDCSICYDAIELRDRHQYMLAPCNHLFHASCLRQWMDQKMECPVCRTELPTI